jgi:hypothetical protein
MTFADIEFPQDDRTPISTQVKAVRQAQAWVASFVQDGRSLSDELIAERRSEALSK